MTNLTTPRWYVQQYGSGERVYVGLHGWSGDHHSFDALLPHLPQDVTFFALDLPGCGQSSVPRTWQMIDVMDALQQQILSLGLSSFAVVGNCSGGLLGMWLLRHVPEMPIAHIYLIDTFGFMPWYFRIFLIPGLGPLLYSTTFANPIGRWLTNRSLRHVSSESTDITASFAHSSVQSTFQYLQLFRDMGDYRSFHHIQVPVTLLHGERTFAAIKQSIPLWQTIFPSAPVHVLPGAGHLSVQEAPHAVARIVFYAATA